MYYITGDIHAEVGRLTEMPARYGLGKGDTLVVAGDFGCVFGTEGDSARLETLAKLPYEILFLDGNHECFPKIFAFPEEEWNGGRVHRLCPNVLHLMRGQVYELEGKTVFTMGGGCSIDRVYRREGVSWWPEEMPSDEEYAEARQNLVAHGRKADILISHAAPAHALTLWMQRGVLSYRFDREAKLNGFLESVRQTVAHERYYFGHMHLDDELEPGLIALYHGVYPLFGGERVPERTPV
ncbi:MAG: metallophosphoesterase [Clostridia bacterium]|nr:metallophosphoesterase [Clostridia bacterium]